jgi:hypothetical protein
MIRVLKAGRKDVIDVRPEIYIRSEVSAWTTRKVIRRCETYSPAEEGEEVVDVEPSDTNEEENELEEDEDADFVTQAVRALKDFGCSYGLSPVEYDDPDEVMDYRTGETSRCRCILDGFSFKELNSIAVRMGRK